MTPERKKKLRLLLRRKAAEELKRQQEAKATERRKVITQRTGQKKALDSLSDGKLFNEQPSISSWIANPSTNSCFSSLSF